MTIRFWKWGKPKAQEQSPWEFAEKPMLIDYEAQHRETMDIIEDILRKLDEIKILVDEMKEEEKNQ
jgi:hypothetical protein